MLHSLSAICRAPQATGDSLMIKQLLQDSSRHMEQALQLCNLLSVWSILNVVASMESIPILSHSLDTYLPGYLIYKTAVVAVLVFWYGLDSDMPLGPFVTHGGRGVRAGKRLARAAPCTELPTCSWLIVSCCYSTPQLPVTWIRTLTPPRLHRHLPRRRKSLRKTGKHGSLVGKVASRSQQDRRGPKPRARDQPREPVKASGMRRLTAIRISVCSIAEHDACDCRMYKCLCEGRQDRC